MIFVCTVLTNTALHTVSKTKVFSKLKLIYHALRVNKHHNPPDINVCIAFQLFSPRSDVKATMEECRTYTLWNKTWPRDLFMRHPLPHYKTSTLSNKDAYEKPTWVMLLGHHWDSSGTPWETTGIWGCPAPGGCPALGDALEDFWGMLLFI